MDYRAQGKQLLQKKITKKLKCKWINADEVRKKFNDWDFSRQGILRQSKRMAKISNQFKKSKFIIADFICPFKKGRDIFKPDILIWMDTIKKGRFNKNSIDHLFQEPKVYNYRIKRKNSNLWAKKIVGDIVEK